MKNFYYFIIVILLLNGCTMSSGILPLSKDTYNITIDSYVSASSAKKTAIKEAIKYCEKDNKVIEVQRFNVIPGEIDTADLVFMCVHPSEQQSIMYSSPSETEVNVFIDNK